MKLAAHALPSSTHQVRGLRYGPLTSSRGAPAVRRAAVATLVALSVIATSGCRPDRGSGQEHDQKEEHAGHVIPAHKPRSFPEAVRRMRSLNEQIGRKVAERAAKSLVDDQVLTIALDVANWLPEIAADSDMPESLWNRVNADSGTIVAEYQRILARTTKDVGSTETASALKNAAAAITDLESLLAHSKDLAATEGRDEAHPRQVSGVGLQEDSRTGLTNANP